jgi:hypothetical protein
MAGMVGHLSSNVRMAGMIVHLLATHLHTW